MLIVKRKKNFFLRKYHSVIPENFICPLCVCNAHVCACWSTAATSRKNSEVWT